MRTWGKRHVIRPGNRTLMDESASPNRLVRRRGSVLARVSSRESGQLGGRSQKGEATLTESRPTTASPIFPATLHAEGVR